MPHENRSHDYIELEEIVDSDGERGKITMFSTDGEQINPSLDHDDKRVVGVFKLAMLAYFLTCGGPFGIEEAVGAAGPFYALLACIVLPVVWALPQALVTAELSSMMPENGGNVVWIQAALGDFWGFVGAWNSQIAATVDLAIYPVIVVDYIPDEFGLTPGQEIWVRIAVILLAVKLNLFGLDPLSYVSYALVIAMLTPFVVLVFIADGAWDYSDFQDTPDEYDWGVFLGAVLWAYTGWDSCGAFAGEVSRPSYTYPRGVALALTFNVFNFAVPILFGYLISPEIEEWENGYFTDLADDQARWLGDWIMLASVLSSIGQLNVQLATSSRTLWAMAHGEGMMLKVPRFLSQEWKRFGTPVVAVVVNAAMTMALSLLPFYVLVTIEMFFACVSLSLMFVAFLKLKIYDRSRRPYEVPGGVRGAWIISVLSVLLLVGSMLLASWETIVIGVGSNVLLISVYYVRTFFITTDRGKEVARDVRRKVEKRLVKIERMKRRLRERRRQRRLQRLNKKRAPGARVSRTARRANKQEHRLWERLVEMDQRMGRK